MDGSHGYELYYIITSIIIGLSIAIVFLLSLYRNRHYSQDNHKGSRFDCSSPVTDIDDGVSPDDPSVVASPFGTIYGDPPPSFMKLSNRVNITESEGDGTGETVGSHVGVQAKVIEHYENEMEDKLTKEEKDNETEIRRKQLEEIFKLMAKNEEFGVNNVDELKSQMGLYSTKI